MKDAIAEQVISTRAKLGLSASQFGDLLGVHHITVSKWEKGTTKPTPYQQTLIEQFDEAAANDPELKEGKLLKILIGAGAIAALAFLLKHLMKNK